MSKKVVMIVETATGSKFAPEVDVEEFSLEEVMDDSSLTRWYEFMKKFNRTFHSDCNVLYRLIEDE